MAPIVTWLACISVLVQVHGGSLLPRGRRGVAVTGVEAPLILQPSAGVEEVALLVVPATNITNTAYNDLGLYVMAASPLRLWVGLVSGFSEDQKQQEAAMNSTLEVMQSQGMTTQRILVAAHSSGGVWVKDWAFRHALGVVLMGHLDSWDIPSILPVMHLSGDLDGLSTVTHARVVYNQLVAASQASPELALQQPVAVLQDVNHWHYASQGLPDLVAQNDILSPLSQEGALALISHHLAAFLLVTVGYSEPELTESKAVLQQAFLDTQVIMQPVNEMWQVTDGGNGSQFTELGQRIMSAVMQQYQGRMQVIDTLVSNLELGPTKPQVVDDGNRGALVTTFSSSFYLQENATLTFGPFAPDELATKFKSRDAIRQVLEPQGVEFGPQVSCMEVNQAAVTLALESCTEVVRSRFQTRGVSFIFLPDDVQATGATWLGGHITYNLTLEGLYVGATSLPTGVDVGFGLGGMHYCKVLSPSRALEHIMVDSLRGTTPL